MSIQVSCGKCVLPLCARTVAAPSGSKAGVGSLDPLYGRRCATGEHDYGRVIRRGRATWICPKCSADISLEYVLLMDALDGASSPIDRLQRSAESGVQKQD